MSIITVAQAKIWARIDYDSEDADLQLVIDSLEEWLEERLGIKFVESAFTCECDGAGESLWPQWKPVISVTSITDRITGTVNAEDYYIANNAKIIKNSQGRWDEGNARWSVIYTAGYDGTGDDSIALPAGIKMGMRDLFVRAYDNRGGKGSESISGWNVNWDDIETSDIFEKLSVFDRTIL